MKYRLLILFAVFAIVAAACSSSDDDATETTVASGGETTETTVASGGETTETTVASGGSADATTIDFWVAFTDDNRLGYSQDRAAEFNTAHPEYNVQVTAFETYNDVFDAAVLSVDSGEPPG